MAHKLDLIIRRAAVAGAMHTDEVRLRLFPQRSLLSLSAFIPPRRASCVYLWSEYHSLFPLPSHLSLLFSVSSAVSISLILSVCIRVYLWFEYKSPFAPRPPRFQYHLDTIRAVSSEPSPPVSSCLLLSPP